MNTQENKKPKPIVFLLTIGAFIFVVAGSLLGVANTPPQPAFIAWLAVEKGETVVSFDASSSEDPDGRIISYQWTFGDGMSGSGMTIDHTYPAIGSYDVTLLVLDESGSARFLTKTIDITTLPTSPTEAAENPPVYVDPNIPVGTKVGERAPDFSLPDFDGEIVHLSDFLGKVVLLEFWRSSCPHCVASTPHLEELRKEFEDQDFVVIVIILDYNPAEGKLLLAQNGYTRFITVHELDSNHQTAETYGISTIPRAFLIDKTGVIRYSGGPSNIDDEMISGWL